MKLTVIMRDEMPMIIFNDAPRYRSVQIDLTDEQIEKLKPKNVGSQNGEEIYESYSRCFLEK